MDFMWIWILRYSLVVWLVFRIVRFLWRMIVFAQKIERQLVGPPVHWSKWFWSGNLGGLRMSHSQDEIINKALNLLETSTRFFPDNAPRFWLAFYPFALVHRADHAKLILSSNVNINKAQHYDMLKPWLNESLLTSHNTKWHQRRKFLTPAFHFNILEEFVPIMNEQANILVDIIQERSGKEEFLDVYPMMTNVTLAVITETAMGVKMDLQRNAQHQNYAQTLARMSHMIFKRMIFPWLHNDLLYFNLTSEGKLHRQDLDLVHKFAMDVIHKRKADVLRWKSEKLNNVHASNDPEEQRNRRRRLAFMDLLMEQHLAQPEQFTETDIREEVDTFMFAGHDTTSTSLTWTLYLLGNHPEFQQRLHEEIDSIALSKDKNEEDFTGWTVNQLRQMRLLEACIKESLRLYPPVPVIARMSDEEIPLGNGNVIPKDTTVLIFVSIIQRDRKYFERPEFFIPDRFMGDNGHPINPFAFIPFSAGPRNCIGQRFALQEQKIMLATILRRFRIRSRLPVNAILTHSELIQRPKGPVDIRFEPRSSSVATG